LAAFCKDTASFFLVEDAAVVVAVFDGLELGGTFPASEVFSVEELFLTGEGEGGEDKCRFLGALGFMC